MLNCKKCYWYGIYDDGANYGTAFCTGRVNLVKLSPPYSKENCRLYKPPATKDSQKGGEGC